jgi:propanol-preferring alcohol dehydrogenase
VRAVVVAEPGPIETGPLALVDAAVPSQAPGELLIRVAACAVCRTDLQIAEGDLPVHQPRVIPGHQAVGRVEAVAPGVAGWSVGDAVGVGWLASACGECAACLAERENLCPDARFTGWDRDGGYAGWLTARADFALRLPAGLEAVDAAPLLCGGVIGYRSLRVSGIEAGGRLGLYGFGASALLALQVARWWGCEVCVVTRSAEERQRAERFGAAWVGGYDDAPPAPLDAAVTFAPVGSVVVAALRSLAPGGTVAINAIHLDGIPAFDYDLLWRERGLRSVANYTRRDALEFLELAARIPLRTEVEVFDLAAATEALTRLRAGRLEGTAVLTGM